MSGRTVINNIKLVCILHLIVIFTVSSKERLSENERVENWYRRGNTWPPTWSETATDTEIYRRNMATREEEIQRIPGGDERWENWMQHTQSRMLPRLTEMGFEKVPTPAHIQQKLKAAVDEGVRNWDNLRLENQVGDSIYGPNLPKFVDLGELAQEVMHDPIMISMHEEWAGGIDLLPTSSYGVRLYQNGSTMVMHNDKPFTHVISSIVHIAHEYYDENEPWTIEIEDHNGELHSMVLEEGEMMFYESAKCLHGRMFPLKGKYFGSIFVHYKPKDENLWNYDVSDVISNVPPHWKEGVIEDHGSRWAGQAITVDSRIVYGAPPRVLNVDKRQFVNGESMQESDAYDEYDDEQQHKTDRTRNVEL